MKYFTHLVCSGSAIRSLCLLGILRYIYFNKLEHHIKNASGTSMGAFFCLAFALKIPIDKLEEIIIKAINNTEIRYVSSAKLLNLFTDLGINDSKLYLSGIKEYIKDKYDMDDITFIELSKLTGVNVYVSTTKINDGSNFIFNVNDTPNISVIDAIAASMCIPVISKPVKIENNYYVDGCITNNLPFNVFDNINHDDILCVAVYVENDYYVTELIESSEDINFFMYYKQVFNIIYANSLQTTYIKRIQTFKNPLIIKNSHFKTFYNIEITNNSIEFNITQNDIENLILQGFKDITEYMKLFDDKNNDIRDDIKDDIRDDIRNDIRDDIKDEEKLLE
jgi:predicted acylesterase/phospholipase RssA